MDRVNLDKLSEKKCELRSALKSSKGRVSILLEPHLKFFPQGVWGAFKPLSDEPLLDFPAEAQLAWPKIESSEKMSFYFADEFKKSSYGFLEPGEEACRVSKDEISVIFIPGQAFDFYGNRLGRGKGFYDRYLKAFKGLKVGVCSGERFLSNPLPVDFKFDEPVHYVLSERFLYKINPFKKVV